MILNMLVAAQEAGTAKEAIEYAAREATAPGLEHFAGGDGIGLLVGVAVLVLLVVLIWWLLGSPTVHN